MKKKKIIFFIVGSLLLLTAAAIWIIHSMYEYISVKIVDVFDKQEYLAICEEYCLDPEMADIEYIYSAGGDTFGIRLLLPENALENLNIIFTEDMLSEEYSDYVELRKSSIGSPVLSDGIEREAVKLELDDTISQKHHGFYVFCWVFTIDDKYYMEMDTQRTDNIEIYQKNF